MSDKLVVQTADKTFLNKNNVNLNAASAPTTVSGSVLQLVGLDGANAVWELDTFGTGFTSMFLGRLARGTAALPTAIQTNDSIASFAAQGYGASAYASTIAGGLTISAGENWTNSANGSVISLSTTPAGSTTRRNVLVANMDGTITLPIYTTAGVLTNDTSGNVISTTSPALGTATATSINGLTITSTTGTLTIANGKVVTFSNQIAFTATDGSTLAIGTGAFLSSIATLGTAADKGIYTTAINTAAEYSLTSAGRALVGLSTTELQRASIGAEPNNNLIQNGAMEFDQFAEGGSLTLTSGAGQRGPADRWWTSWTVSTSSAGDPSVKSQATSAGLNGFPRSFLVTASGTPSTTTPAGLLLSVAQRIEGSNIADLAFGTAGAQQFTVSVWLKTSITNANFSVGFLNSASNRAYAHICNVPVANTWTKCSFTVTADITGTWLSAPGTVGLAAFIVLDGGSNFQGTADTWAASVGITTSAQTQFTDTASATLEFTGFKIERGAVATAYVPEPAAQALAKLQRYYRKSFPLGTAPAQSGGVAGAVCVQNPIANGQPSMYVAFNPPMYAAPTITTYNPSAGNANWRNVTGAADVTVSVDPTSSLSSTGVNIATGATVATIAHNLAIHYTASVSLF